MNRACYLGIDVGTTVLKAALFAASGRTLCGAAIRLPVKATADGGRTLTAGAIDRALRHVTGELRRAAGNAWARVAGVGLSAQGGSSLFADRATGRPSSEMYLWNDMRAAAWVSRLAEEVGTRFWQRFALFDSPPTGLGRLAWLKEERPALFARDAIHIGAGEHVFHRFTGVWRQDAGNAIQVGSYNARKRRLDGAAFALIGLPLSLVAPLRSGHETSPLSAAGARVLGLGAGIPVAGPYIDQEAAYMSSLGAFHRPLQCSLGTAWVGNFILPDGVRGSSPSQLVIPSPDGNGRLVLQPLYVGNNAWDWALSEFVDRDLPTAIRKAGYIFSKRLLPPPGLVAAPWCTYPNPLVPGACGAGLFAGIGSQTARADLVRATAAGLVYELGRVFDAVKDSGAVDGVVLCGGASKGFYFRRLAAAVFDPLPVVWQSDYDYAAARGALFGLNSEASRGTFEPVSAKGVDKSELTLGRELYARMLGQMHIGDSGFRIC